MRLILSVIAVCVCLLGTASTARAQYSFTTGLSGGVSIPAATLNASHSPGFNAAAHVGIRMPASAAGFRLEGFYNQFHHTGFTCGGPCILPGLGSGTVRVRGGAANVIFNFAVGGASPYLIGGAGSYHLSQDARESSTHLGLNVGLGARMKLARAAAFVEARFHTIRRETKVEYVPVTFGIEF